MSQDSLAPKVLTGGQGAACVPGVLERRKLKGSVVLAESSVMAV